MPSPKSSKRRWGLVILDVSLPGRGSLEILKEALALRPGVPIMMLSVHAEDQYAIRALRAGAAGYVTKETAAEDLTAAIRKVLQGGKYVSPRLAEQMAAALSTRDGTTRLLHEGLSDRELRSPHPHAGGRQVRQGDWSRPGFEREDHQHLSNADHRQDENAIERRHHGARAGVFADPPDPLDACRTDPDVG